MSLIKYKQPIEDQFNIVTKDGEEQPFALKPAQEDFLKQATGRDIILKCRQLGFSSLILALFACDFIYRENTYSVVIADNSDNSADLLDRVKFYIKCWEEKNKCKIPMKYNSKYEMYNTNNNARYKIGTAENREFGRSKTITNLHLSELAFYPDPERILAGALQAVTPKGRVIIETTANGFNYLKTLWDESEMGERTFQNHFYSPGWEYDKEFLEQKKKELKRLYPQEYPQTAQEAFLTSGDCYFDLDILREYLEEAKEPIEKGLIYV